jgi:hypothetical protein
MGVKLLNEKELGLFERASLPDLIIDKIAELEKEIKLNKIREDVSPLFNTGDRKIRVSNLIKLLLILEKENKHNALTGRILVEVPDLLRILMLLKSLLDSNHATTEQLKQQKSLFPEINKKLQLIIQHLEQWERDIKKKINLPIGNKHTKDTYHPAFPKTYKYKPSFLPDDYRSNWFFEIKVKELCPFLTTIQFHPFNDIQASFQVKRTTEELFKVNINVELRSNQLIEETDNIRAVRLHSPHDKKDYPGSYLIIKGGHHRIKEIFERYLKGEIDGEKKILVQTSQIKDFARIEDLQTNGKTLNQVLKKEISKRDQIRLQIQRSK